MLCLSEICMQTASINTTFKDLHVQFSENETWQFRAKQYTYFHHLHFVVHYMMLACTLTSEPVSSKVAGRVLKYNIFLSRFIP